MSADTFTSCWFGYVRKSVAEIETLAFEILDGKVFGTWDLPADKHPQLVFLALVGIDPLQAAEIQRLEVTHCYNYLPASGPRDIEGLPVFLDHFWLDKRDAELVQVRVDQLAAARKNRGAT